MSKRHLQNENLDRIGRRLLGARKARSEEIERLIASPALFETLKNKIETERTRRDVKPVKREISAFSVFFTRRRSAFVAAALLFLLTTATVYLTFDAPTQISGGQTANFKVEETENPSEIEPDYEKPEKPAAVLKTDSKQKNYVEKIGFTTAVNLPADSKKMRRKPKPEKELKTVRNIPQVKFYALGFPDNQGGAGEELQVVRAELSRAELFALGVNLPIENGPEKIKTDLLVGRDGVARAIRLIE